MDKITLNALQEQYNRERWNREVYRGYANQLEALAWPGSAKYMYKASDEEGRHADKFASYIIDRNELPAQRQIEVISLVSNNGDPTAFFEAAYKQEVSNTEKIRELHYTAEQTEEIQTCTFLIWAIEEQTAAEREFLGIVMMFKRLGADGKVFYDKEIGGM